MIKSNRVAVSCLVLFLSAVLAPTPAWAGETTVEIEPRPGVTLRLLAGGPDDAKAVAILFPGGHGKVKVTKNGTHKKLKGNFLVRTRRLLADKGLAYAVIDSPLENKERTDMTFEYRSGETHAADIIAAIAAVRKKTGKPVWLIGTSRGSTSVANAASRFPDGGFAGAVMTAGKAIENARGGNILDFDLASIKVPTLVVHHENDGCKQTPFSAAKDIAPKIKAGELMVFTGGKAGKPKGVCGGKSHHGFFGIEADVVGKIADWIKSR